ncbi:hypothetical protein BDEG_20888 [Batrachochytrium dendrobatidis JEL423]|uniref:Uncharacterized protein n=1 Tax=Batrachochytrium dendrobatidis (strain JEL423) TaxID=403673 RepID=A0A177W9H6_BATDL|nr:hypothetical protein BDEG_20888 [Batrachochytrium dendrobatidis JEL423]
MLSGDEFVEHHDPSIVCRLPEDRIVIFNILPELCVAGHDQMDWVVHQMYHHQVYTMRLAAVSHQLVDFKVYPSRDQLHRHESEPVWMVEVDHVYASTAITASQCYHVKLSVWLSDTVDVYVLEQKWWDSEDVVGCLR